MIRGRIMRSCIVQTSRIRFTRRL